MQSIRGVVRDIQTKSAQRVGGKTTVKNYSTIGANEVANSRVQVGDSMVSFTRVKKYEELQFEKGDEIIVVGNKAQNTIIASAYHNVTKNITKCLELKNLIIYIVMCLIFTGGMFWSFYQIYTGASGSTIYILGFTSTLFFVIFSIIAYMGYSTRSLLYKKMREK